jgi:tripartite-type tricarboxylate transporter receptor subunit TctC
MLTWYGLFGPPNMPRAIVDKWQQDVAKVVAMPDVQERIAAVAAEPRASTPESSRHSCASNTRRWASS